ncbi:hypothetical protein [Caulobacter sp. SSI4214]|uniref:hypothetical protein n=1 Tax=Caulobacter sp. SSI4214 TaxID=2575739 RepID=UPI00143C295B|nr:hypothetical protein [Caulobacter sp. SSI4214]
MTIQTRALGRAPAPFAPRHAADAWFFPAMTALVWLGVIAGFGGEMWRLSKAGQLSYPLIVHVHAAVFTGWLVLFTAQVALVRRGQVALHRRLGMIGMGVAAVMTALGPLTAFYVQAHALGTPKSDPPFLAVPLSDILSFAGLILAGYRFRSDPAAHKRLMLLATIAVADAGFGRWTLALFGDWVMRTLGAGFVGSLAVGNSLSIPALLAVPIHDLVTRGRVRPVVAIATAWAVGWQVLATALYLQPGWVALTKRFVTWLATL